MKLKKGIKFFVFLSILVLVLLAYSYVETYWIKVKTVEIQSGDVPDSFCGKQIVFISDIHHGPYFSKKRVTKLVDRINALNPDFVVLGGDYVHRDAKYIQPVFDELAKLTSNYGIYVVLGNHDHWEDAKQTRKFIMQNGFNICDNSSYWIRIGTDSIKIGGVGDLWEDNQLIDSVLHDVQTTDFCVLISHNPDYIEDVSSNLVDLVLSGHTHGGQISLFGLWAPLLPSSYGQKYRYGLKHRDNMQFYITSGVGTITPPLRFFCRPEIVVIELFNPHI